MTEGTQWKTISPSTHALQIGQTATAGERAGTFLRGVGSEAKEEAGSIDRRAVPPRREKEEDGDGTAIPPPLLKPSSIPFLRVP